MADALAPLVVELHNLDDIDRHRAPILAEMRSGRRVTVMARHHGSLCFVFRTIPAGEAITVVAADVNCTGRFPTADRALAVGMRQAERLLSGRFE